MIIKRFTAKKVHGYLNFDIFFKEDINFLVGHNGCGKTTALKLIMALLTPDIKELARIPFESCSIDFIVAKTNKLASIRVNKDDFKLYLMSSLSPERFEYGIESIINDDFDSSEMISSIAKLANPILISLDRKFSNSENNYKIRFKHQIWPDDPYLIHDDEVIDPLSDVKSLIKNEIRSIDRKNIVEDERLKDKILIDAFNVIEVSNGFSFDNDFKLSDLEVKRSVITNALESLSLRNKNLINVQEATDKYFYELKKNVNELKRFENDKNKMSKMRYIEAMTFMFANKPQITRIDNLVKFIRSSQLNKTKAYEKVDLFESIVNSFFSQTGKKISIKTGNLKINVNGTDIEVNSLSSGETQIITLFAHIIFNRRLLSKASFMIDEPELSLHLAWQEMFVDSLKKANANLQVILATHSPAIINGFDDKCVFVNGENNMEGSF
ncbi:AAA family ATPase [Photobacterium chitinilyticum]|uniref:AAA+ ATPase domain-containing protein n=1 Tax=Photobacterium chitinilyticum TaxID=2485123 RepID=A0A444JL27_9GAMM|nr:AAA family ATPase [Photobacterium chitinilyticum]RWX53801.1 hypothetical protein EDI28_20325 [Photobacterium chitinilyticum]